jgi:putative flippase GtrA
MVFIFLDLKEKSLNILSKYSIVSGLALCVDVVLFYILNEITIIEPHYIVCISYSIGGIIGYILLSIHVFNQKINSKYNFIVYWSTLIFGMFLSSIVYYVIDIYLSLNNDILNRILTVFIVFFTIFIVRKLLYQINFRIFIQKFNLY